MIRVLIADDQALIRSGFAALLSLEPDLEVVGAAADAEETVALAAEHRPDVVLLDVQMPGRDGISAAPDILAASPGSRILMLTTFGRPGYLQRAMASGATGFLVKDTPPEALAEAVRQVSRGVPAVDPQVAVQSAAAGSSPLTPREREVLVQAQGGGTVSDIARSLTLSEGTVRNHLSSAMSKLSARTRAEAARIAADNGWL